MRLPALWLTVAFAAGIVVGLAADLIPGVWIACVVASVVAGFAFTRRNWFRPAWMATLLAWFALGALGATLEHAAVPANHVTQLVSSGRLDLSEPLRWRGRLRSDPVRLPWGFRTEIDLEQVESAGQSVQLSGGMRLNYYRREGEEPSIVAFRAGDRVEFLARARTPRNFLTPGFYDSRAQLARQNIHLTASLRSVELLVKLGDAAPTLAHRFARVRGHLLTRLSVLFRSAPDQAAVLRAMLLGDYNFLDRDVSQSFQRTSVYHVLVISGLHVVALVAFVWWVARRLRVSLVLTVIAVFIALAFFVAIVEDRPPIERAALMATVVLLARLLFRRVQILNTLAVAALLVLLLRPSSLSDASFQLSFLAALIIGGIALPLVDITSAPFRKALENLSDVTRDAAHSPRAIQFRLDLRSIADWFASRLPARLAQWSASLLAGPCAAAFRLWEVFLISLTVQLGLLPLMAHFFHRISVSGPLANMPASVLSALIVPFGFVTLGLDALWTRLATLAAPITGWFVQALLFVVQAINAWPRTAYRIPGPPAWVLVAFYFCLVLAALAAVARHRRWTLLLSLPLAALLFVTATYPFPPQLAPGILEASVLDVGQGDSIFVAFPDGRTLLIDGGGTYGANRVGGVRIGMDIGESVVSPYLWQRGIRRLDVIALSHAHTDHLDGLNAILENFRVQELWIGRAADTQPFRDLLAHARARGVRVVDHSRGNAFSWGAVTGLVLWPEDRSQATAASNNDSLVLRLEYGRRAFLLPGDIEKPIESDLVLRGDPLVADVLKVPHHGSRTSATESLLEVVHPSFAVISVGETNSFGHPHRETLDRLRAAHVRTFRTDQDGTVTFTSDGNVVWVKTFVAGDK
ncbi:MAG: DNA internalization-related competence protein ComEC/Rec2 [Acidobacteria bacterium]|nr:DNA internalization-related competence protein ComEC/Rec2 [Acidobacteriota bacterium]MCL5289320.1 DNA internalization-related competence protein ComEC/Rec2 [Acidobacteriota bacterium]